MPRIPHGYLDAVAYVYESEEAAQAGSEFGATAFFVSMPSGIEGRRWHYAVTNWHAACQRGQSVLRVNKADGSTDIIPHDPSDWTFTPRFDIAVIPVNLDYGAHRYANIPIEAFITPAEIEKHGIGPGDDAFMIGRFVAHDGGPVNYPSVRFGHISVMPLPIEQSNGKMADSFCIDLHSRPGYSGSPVFVYRTWASDLREGFGDGPKRIALAGNNYLMLLGIHFAQFSEKWDVALGYGVKAQGRNGTPVIGEGAYVRGLSGMTCVLPAWSILEVLNLPVLKGARDKWLAEELARQRESGPSGAEGG